MEYFISLFPRMSCHQKYFETVNETIPKMHDFILEFYNTIFYVVQIGYLCDEMKFMDPMLILWGFIFFRNSVHPFSSG
jgi:hypothetical protein